MHPGAPRGSLEEGVAGAASAPAAGTSPPDPSHVPSQLGSAGRAAAGAAPGLSRGEVAKPTGSQCKLGEAGLFFCFFCIYLETSTAGSWFMTMRWSNPNNK